MAFLMLFAVSASADTYDNMRVNWFNNLTGGTTYDATDPTVVGVTTSITSTANSDWTLLKAARTSGAFGTTCFSDLSLSDSANVTTAFSRLNDMTQAYWAKGGSLYQSTALKTDIISALDWLNTNVYTPTKAETANWWDWEIGVPLQLNNTVVMLYDSLSTAQVTNYMAAVNHFTSNTWTSGGDAGANGAWASMIVGLRGVIVKDPAKTALAVSTFSTLTANVSSSDGFYNDGSYVGHSRFAYTGGYGFSLLQTLADGYYLFNPASSDPLPTSKRAVAYNWVFNSYQPLMYQGKMPYSCVGRDISRGPASGMGSSIAACLAQLALGDTSASAGQVRAFAKNVFAYAGNNYGSYGDIGILIRMMNLMTDVAVAPSQDAVGTTVFSAMDRATSLQNGFGADIAYYSTRQSNFEAINGENQKGWHQSDGMLYLENADWNQYNGNFWATVNSYRLPGTTVNASTGASADQFNGNSFAGGVTLDGLYGAVGFILRPPNGQTLVANKSWFFFDDQIVCLGAGITSTDAKTVETIVENRKLNTGGANVLTVNGTAQPTSLGWASTPSGVKWMHLVGSVNGADIGYYFPAATTLSLLREARTSSWSTLDSSRSKTSVTDNYLTAILTHGTNPTNSSYAYILLPGRSAVQVAAYSTAPTVSVLQNDGNAASVYDAKLAASGTVFWQDQSAQTLIDKASTSLTSDKKAVVMTQTSGDQFTVSVSDPTQSNTAGINLTISRPFASLISADPGITVTQLGPTLMLNVATSGAKGKTFQAVFTTTVIPTGNPGAGTIPVVGVSASANDGNVPGNTLDNDLNTRWSAQGDGQWIKFDFANPYNVISTSIAFYGGTTRKSNFDVMTSMDGMTWTKMISGVSSGATNDFQTFPLPASSWARHVKIIGHGNSQGTGWNSLTEVQFSGTTAVATYADYGQLNFTPAQWADPAISGPGACPAGDGVTNLMKYSQGLPPLANVSGTPAALPAVQGLNGYLTLTYVRLKYATDLIYTPEVSNDLVNWQSGVSCTRQSSVTDLDSRRQQVVVQTIAQMSTGDRQMMRLRVESIAAKPEANVVRQTARSNFYRSGR